MATIYKYYYRTPTETGRRYFSNRLKAYKAYRKEFYDSQKADLFLVPSADKSVSYTVLCDRLRAFGVMQVTGSNLSFEIRALEVE
jgi:hypothetical protein